MSAPIDGLSVLEYDLAIPQDSDWAGVAFPILNPNGTPYDLTGCSALGQIRPSPGSDELYYSWSTSPASGQGLITLDVPSSTLTIRVLAAESALWTFTDASYDIVLINTAAPLGMQKPRVVMGHVYVSRQATAV